MTKTKTFGLTTIKAIKQAERFKAKLENDGYSVKTKPFGLDSVRITGRIR